MTRYDAIVIGTGPAGCLAARDLARSGARVLLLEKETLPRTKICAGGVPPHMARLTGPLPAELIECSVAATTFTYRFGDPIRVHSGDNAIAMVMRAPYDHWLAQQAVAAGAELRERECVATVAETPAGVTVITEAGVTYGAEWLIGADGAHSRVARALRLTPHRYLGVAVNAEVQVTPEDYTRQDAVAAMDIGMVTEGYGWIFPKRAHFSCGIGSARRRLPEAKKILAQFLDGMPTTRGRVAAEVRGWPLPYCVGLDPLVGQRTMLAGDAACLVDPLSGEGIYFAARSGILAAQTIIAGASLASYQEQIDTEIRADLAYARQLADIFFAHPYICYKLGVKNRKVVGYFEQLLRGERTYRSIFTELKAEFSAPFRAFLAALKK